MTTKFKMGESVQFHPIIGGEAGGTFVVRAIQPEGIPSCPGAVYWLDGKAGCVAEAALSRTTKFKVGDRVYHHRLAGGPPTNGLIYTVLEVVTLDLSTPDHEVYMLTEFCSAVQARNLSLVEPVELLPIFENADFFDSEDGGDLTWTDPEEYIDDLRANGGDYHLTNNQWLNVNCPLKVHGWTRDEVDFDEVFAAKRAMETFHENMMDDNGDPGGSHELWTADERKEIVDKLTAVFKEACSKAISWRCTATTSREYSRDEVEAILQDYA